MGQNSGYLSLSLEEYAAYDVIPGNESLYKMLIDKDPYKEFYYSISDKIFNEKTGIDTAFINNLIKTNSLERYFEKVK